MSATRISVWESPQLQATILALNGMDKELAAQVRKATRSVTEAEWRTAMSAHASTRIEHSVMVRSARVTVSNQNITLKAGGMSTRHHGGGRTYELFAGTEFGSKRFPQFKARKRSGYVFFPATADVVPRFAALWVSTMIRTLHEAFEGGP